MQETWVWSLGQEDALEKGYTAHSRILSWRIPRTEEPGGLQCIRWHRVRHDWARGAGNLLCHLLPLGGWLTGPYVDWVASSSHSCLPATLPTSTASPQVKGTWRPKMGLSQPRPRLRLSLWTHVPLHRHGVTRWPCPCQLFNPGELWGVRDFTYVFLNCG